MRPSKFGNPIKIGAFKSLGSPERYTRAEAYQWYLEHVTQDSELGKAAKRELKGLHLACLCPLTEKLCHAEILLRIANEP